MATSHVQHRIPPAFTLPPVPRVRPPRMLPGTPSPNTNPQPAGPVPPGRVWVQGKWRDPRSSAAKDRQRIQSRRIEKALEHQNHGMNIYAYSHLRTKQVVYSLTRVLQNSKIMPQLLFHGKKTVPEALRRDLWTPYFSVHFPPTPAGAQAGLVAYRDLRQVSMQRQLSPPDEFILTTQDDIDRYTKKYDPVDLEELRRVGKLKEPLLNKILPKRLRARKVMDQKATSVADVAFVLGLQLDTMASPNERLKNARERAARKGSNRGQKYRRRLRFLAEKREKLEKKLAERAELAKVTNDGQMPLERYASKRISMEYQGRVIGNGEVDILKELDEVKASTRKLEQLLMDAEEGSKDSTSAQPDRSVLNDESRKVRILWADIRDGTYAQEWPENVVHNELESKALTMGKSAPLSGSVHVLGNEKGGGFYGEFIEDRDKAAALAEQQVRFQVGRDFLAKLVAVSMKLDEGILKAVDMPRLTSLPHIDILHWFIYEKLIDLSHQVTAAGTETGEEFSEVKERVGDLVQRVQSSKMLLEEVSTERGARDGGESRRRDRIMPLLKYVKWSEDAASLSREPGKAYMELLPLEIEYEPKYEEMLQESKDEATADEDFTDKATTDDVMNKAAAEKAARENAVLSARTLPAELRRLTGELKGLAAEDEKLPRNGTTSAMKKKNSVESKERLAVERSNFVRKKHSLAETMESLVQGTKIVEGQAVGRKAADKEARREEGLTRINALKDEWPVLWRYEEDVQAIRTSNETREAEIAELEGEVRANREKGLHDAADDVKYEIAKLKTLIWEDEQAAVRLWWDLALGPNARRMEIRRQEDERRRKSESAAAARSAPTRQGFLTRLGRGLRSRLSFGGRRDFSTIARRMVDDASVQSPAVEESSATKIFQELRANQFLYRSAVRATELQKRGEEASLQELFALQIGEDVLHQRVENIEAAHPGMARLARAAEVNSHLIAEHGRHIKQFEAQIQKLRKRGAEGDQAEVEILLFEIERLGVDLNTFREKYARLLELWEVDDDGLEDDGVEEVEHGAVDRVS